MLSTPSENKEASSYKCFSKNQLKEYVEVQTWLRTVSSHSSNIYLNALKDFCNWCGKNPKELILERDREKDNPDPNKRTGIKNLILDFRKHLEKQGYAPKTINSRDGAIRGFFSAVLGTSGMINIGNYANKEVKMRHDLIPTLDELRKMLDVSDIYTRFSIIFLAQTGMIPDERAQMVSKGARFVRGAGDEIREVSKYSRVKGHYRTTPDGETVYVRPHARSVNRRYRLKHRY